MKKQAILLKLAQTRLAINHVLRTRAMQKQALGPSLVPFFIGQSPKNLMDRDVGGSPAYELAHGFNKGIQGDPHADNAYKYPISGMAYTTGYGVGDALREGRKFIRNTAPPFLDDTARNLYNWIEPDPKKHVPTRKTRNK